MVTNLMPTPTVDYKTTTAGVYATVQLTTVDRWMSCHPVDTGTVAVGMIVRPDGEDQRVDIVADPDDTAAAQRWAAGQVLTAQHPDGTITLVVPCHRGDRLAETLRRWWWSR